MGYFLWISSVFFVVMLDLHVKVVDGMWCNVECIYMSVARFAIIISTVKPLRSDFTLVEVIHHEDKKNSIGLTAGSGGALHGSRCG